jgi:hypothetical protein
MTKECKPCGTGNSPEARFCFKCGVPFKERVDVYDAFISYRRDEGGSHVATLLKLLVETRFDKHVFLDVDELPVGRFDERLLDIIDRTPNFLLVLSSGCLDRCVDKGDWLKREIVHAFEKRRNVIPIRVDGFAFPNDSRMELLPEWMRVLKNLQGVPYSHIHRDSAIQKVAEYLVASIPAESPPLLQRDSELLPAAAERQPVVSPFAVLNLPGAVPPFVSLPGAGNTVGSRPLFGSIQMNITGETAGGASGGRPFFGAARIRVI